MLTFSDVEPIQAGIASQRREVISAPGYRVDFVTLSWKPKSQMMQRFRKMQLHHIVSQGKVKATWTIDGNPYNYDRSVLVPPGVLVRGEADDTCERRLIMALTPDEAWLTEVAGDEINWSKIDYADIVRFRNAHIDAALRRLVQAARQPHLYHRQFQAAVCSMIGVDVVVAMNQLERSRPALSALFPSAMQRIDDMLYQQDRPIVGIQVLAAELGVSEGHLRRVFKQSSGGETLAGYIQRVKMKRALQLLESSSIGLKRVAYLLGYSHHSAFSAAFRSHYGYAPSKVREH